MSAERIIWMPKWYLYKHKAGEPISPASLLETVPFSGNMVLSDGIKEMFKLIIGSGGTAFNSANTYIGVGDSTVPSSAEQKDLQASVNRTYKKVEPTFPYIDGTTMIFQAAFYDNEANYDWKEFCIRNGMGTGSVCLNRKVEDKGRKNGGIWVLRCEITLVSIPDDD